MSIVLPKLATTGIGSLPEMEIASGLDLAFAMDIPYLPTFPDRRDLVTEQLLGQVLYGLPGVGFTAKGSLIIKDNIAAEDRKGFVRSLEHAWEEGNFAAFLPDFPGSAWPHFLARCREVRPALLKIQLVGPITLSQAMQAGGCVEEPLFELALLLLRARVLALIQILRPWEQDLLFFWDEPGWGNFNKADARHVRAWIELGQVSRALSQAGVKVGLHCCANADLAPLLELPLGILSFDTSLCLESLLVEKEKWTRWLQGGGTLALGVVPTEVPKGWQPPDLPKKFAEAFGDRGTEFLHRCLLTPACGLGNRSMTEAKKVLETLKTLKEKLQ